MAAAGAKAPDAQQGMEEPGTPTARAGSPRTAPDNDSKSVPLNYLQPLSQKSRTPTVAIEFQIGLYDPAEAKLKLHLIMVLTRKDLPVANI